MKRGIQVLLVMFALACSGGGIPTNYEDAGGDAAQVDSAAGGAGSGGSGIKPLKDAGKPDLGGKHRDSGTDAAADAAADVEVDADDVAVADSAAAVDADAVKDSGTVCDPTGLWDTKITRPDKGCPNINYIEDSIMSVTIAVTKTSLVGIPGEVLPATSLSLDEATCTMSLTEVFNYHYSPVIGSGNRVITLQFDSISFVGTAKLTAKVTLEPGFPGSIPPDCTQDYTITGIRK